MNRSGTGLPIFGNQTNAASLVDHELPLLVRPPPPPLLPLCPPPSTVATTPHTSPHPTPPPSSQHTNTAPSNDDTPAPHRRTSTTAAGTTHSKPTGCATRWEREEEVRWVAAKWVKEEDAADPTRRAGTRARTRRSGQRGRRRQLSGRRRQQRRGAGAGRGVEDVYVREAVSKRFHRDTLCEYGESQIKYNSFLHEYDCCSDFGEWRDEEIEEREFIYTHEDSQVDDDTVPRASAGAHGDSEHDVGLLQGEQTIHGTLEPGTNNLHDVETLESMYILSEFMGFVPPVIPQQPPYGYAWSAQDFKKYGFMIGKLTLESNFTASPFCNDARVFLEKLSSTDLTALPDSAEWDICKECRQPLANSYWASRIKVLKGHEDRRTTYLFDTGVEATLHCRIAIDDPAAVLMACRWTGQETDYELCRMLLGRGVAFRTLAPISTSSFKNVPAVQRPLRLNGYQFTQYDYAAYVRERDAMFADHNVVRRALKTGGIIWRLAVHLSFTAVLDGRSGEGGHPDVYVDSEGDGFMDDTCTEEEMDKICGTYTCLHAHRNESQTKSWWPTDKIWRTNTKFPFWTEVQERWFQDRHNNCENGTAYPMTATEYRDKIRRNSHLSRISMKLNAKSVEFLKNVSQGGL
ncbi:hypothetical protein CPC08DRAFT_816804 [Agrocybe pediades]|nr:hypothetical protein CPC08DRAFT_816804 [Agrocybe pediades]